MTALPKSDFLERRRAYREALLAGCAEHDGDDASVALEYDALAELRMVYLIAGFERRAADRAVFRVALFRPCDLAPNLFDAVKGPEYPG
jgi:hypothetical protein